MKILSPVTVYWIFLCMQSKHKTLVYLNSVVIY